VITFPDQEAVTPAGSPVGEPIPVVPVVECVISVNSVLIHNVGMLEAAPTVLSGFTKVNGPANVLFELHPAPTVEISV